MPVSSPFPRTRAVDGHCCAARRMFILLFSGLSLAITLPAVADVPRTDVKALNLNDPYAAHIAEASQRFGLPAAWIRAVMRVESAGNPRAVSSAGAMGLMQVMPRTWADLRADLALGDDPFDPRDNILAGTAYLRRMFERYGSPGFLAAYNAGPGRYDAHRISGRPLPAETQAYVAALTPMISDGAVAPVATTSLEALGWLTAPLFTGRSSVDPIWAVMPASGVSGIDPLREFFASMPRSSGLFVARPASEKTR